MPDALIPIITRIDMTGLNTGLQLAQEYTRRTPADAVNTAATEIAIVTKNEMPFAEMQKIDTGLAVDIAAKIGVRGRPLSTKGGKNKQFISKVGSATGENSDVPLAALIIQASANSDSRYNDPEHTNYRWFRGLGSPFKGVSRAEGARRMREAISKMIARRHSSTHFLMASWIPVIKKMLPFSVNKYRRGSSTGAPLADSSSYFGADLGDAKPATPGSTTALATIESDIGMRGRQQYTMTKAQFTIAAPVLQRAVDQEGRDQMEYFFSKQGKEKLFDPVNKAWK